MKVLVSDALDPAAVERVREAGHDVIEKTGLAGAELVDALRGCHGLMVRGATKVTGDVLKQVDALKVVVRAGTGLDNVDQAVAEERGIQVRNTPKANAVSVAELTFGLLLAFERHIGNASADLRAGRWEKKKYQGRELAGRRLGLIGFGRIGREVARRAGAFQMDVWAHDPLLDRWPADYAWVKQSTLEDMLGAVDYLSLHVPLTEKTRNIIGTAALAQMEPHAVVVNCGRGGTLDENALLAALEAGRLRGAALDVFTTEPPGEHPVLGHPAVIGTPHLGAATDEAQARAGLEAADIVIEVLGEVAHT